VISWRVPFDCFDVFLQEEANFYGKFYVESIEYNEAGCVFIDFLIC
jgi:hypothetical protein